jgi:hypothetical protein
MISELLKSSNLNQSEDSIFSKYSGGESKQNQFSIDEITSYSQISVSVTYPSEISSTYSDSQDHTGSQIKNNPVQVEITGAIGKVFSVNTQLNETLDSANAVLGYTEEYFSPLLAAQVSKINGQISKYRALINRAEKLKNSAEIIANKIDGVIDDIDLRDQFIKSIELKRSNRQLLTVSTGVRRFVDYAIESFTYIEDNSGVIKFRLLLKEVRNLKPHSSIKQVKPTPSEAVSKTVEAKKDKGRQTGTKTTEAKAAALSKSIAFQIGEKSQSIFSSLFSN